MEPTRLQTASARTSHRSTQTKDGQLGRHRLKASRQVALYRPKSSRIRSPINQKQSWASPTSTSRQLKCLGLATGLLIQLNRTEAPKNKCVCNIFSILLAPCSKAPEAVQNVATQRKQADFRMCCKSAEGANECNWTPTTAPPTLITPSPLSFPYAEPYGTGADDDPPCA